MIFSLAHSRHINKLVQPLLRRALRLTTFRTHLTTRTAALLPCCTPLRGFLLLPLLTALSFLTHFFYFACTVPVGAMLPYCLPAACSTTPAASLYSCHHHPALPPSCGYWLPLQLLHTACSARNGALPRVTHLRIPPALRPTPVRTGISADACTSTAPSHGGRPRAVAWRWVLLHSMVPSFHTYWTTRAPRPLLLANLPVVGC